MTMNRRRFLKAAGQCCREVDFSNKTIEAIVAKSGIGQHQADRRGKRPDGAVRPTV